MENKLKSQQGCLCTKEAAGHKGKGVSIGSNSPQQPGETRDMLSFVSLTLFKVNYLSGSVQLRGSTIYSWSHSKMHSMLIVIFSVLLVVSSWPLALQQVQYIKYMQDP